MDIVYDINAKKYQDPGDQVIVQHIKAFKALLDAWPADQGHVAGAWTQLQEHLRRQRRPCIRSKDPWPLPLPTCGNGNEKSLTSTNGINPVLTTGRRCGLITGILGRRLNSYSFKSVDMRNGMDWAVYHKVAKRANKAALTALKTWVQGAIRLKDNSETMPVPGQDGQEPPGSAH